VNFASETVHILAPSEVKTEVIIKAIKAAGYGATLLEGSSDPALHRKGAARALIFATIFAVPAIAISMVMSWHQPIADAMTELFNQYNLLLPPNPEHTFASWIALTFTTPLILFTAWPIHRAALRNFLHPSMEFADLTRIHSRLFMVHLCHLHRQR